MTRRVLPVLISAILAGQVSTALAATSQSDVNFKIYNPQSAAEPATDNATPPSSTAGTSTKSDAAQVSDTQSSQSPANATASSSTSGDSTSPSADAAASASTSGEPQKIASKVLQGYIRVVPSGTKIPIIMDTAVDNDTSQEGDEFSARTGEDLDIDGAIAVPAGSIIKGRIAQLNAARRLDRAGSVALKFDSITTPDNRQIPIVANLVARGGVVHARRGMKDIAIESTIVGLPTLAGLGIGLLAGGSSSGGSSKIGAGGGAMIGAGIGVAVGVAILLSKKGKKIDMRPGDELKIELAEDLRMPMQ